MLVNDLTGIISSDNPHLIVLDNSAAWGNLAPGDTANCAVDPFRLQATADAVLGEMVNLRLIVSGGCDYVDTLIVPVAIGDSVFLPTGPDSYGYRAFDDGDITFGPCPQFSWVEIAGVGTMLSMSDDQTDVISLPPAFGTLQHYGTASTQLSICGNGWVAPGMSTASSYTNTTLPDPSAPPGIIAVLWDDLYPPTSGGVWYYHDEANHRFVVEWDSMPYYASQATFEWFQIAIYDQTVETPTGDNLIVCQYLTANGMTQATFGMQDQTGSVGLLYGLDGHYPKTAAPAAAGRAVAYTTLPLTDVRESGTAGIGTARLRLHPTPFCSNLEIDAGTSFSGPVALNVCDQAGRVVRTLAVSAGGRASWDGRDSGGRKAPAGIYFLVATDGQQTVRTKVVKLD